MKESLNVICRLCFTNEGEGLIFQRFIIMSFNIIKQVLLCPEFKMPKQIDDEETKNCPSVQAHQTKIDFFQQSTVEEICKCLISQYLLLSKDDLELWDSDPEQYGEFEFQISMEYENQFHIKKRLTFWPCILGRIFQKFYYQGDNSDDKKIKQYEVVFCNLLKFLSL